MKVICDKASECKRKNCPGHSPRNIVLDGRKTWCFHNRDAAPIPCKEEAAIPYSELVVGRKYRIERNETGNKGDPYGPGVITITKIFKVGRWFQCDHINCISGNPISDYNFYNITPGSTEPQAKENKMTGQKLFTTAVANIETDKDGFQTIKSINDQQTKNAKGLNQAMIDRHTQAVLNSKEAKGIVAIVGQAEDGSWIRMDEI